MIQETQNMNVNNVPQNTAALTPGAGQAPQGQPIQQMPAPTPGTQFVPPVAPGMQATTGAPAPGTQATPGAPIAPSVPAALGVPVATGAPATGAPTPTPNAQYMPQAAAYVQTAQTPQALYNGPILQAQGLSKSYGNFNALSNVSLALAPGRIVGLLGPNGSGKTTLIKMAAGILVPSSGSLQICGKKPGPETKAIVSYLPDKLYFDSWMRVKDCIDLFADFYSDFDKSKANEMLRLLNIDNGKKFKTLSKGMQERVQLALVMSRSAALYLLDEPIGGVDPAARDFILETIIRNYNEQGTVIISTHLIYDIERVLDDVIFLMNGYIERVASVDQIREQTGKSVDEVFREAFRC